MFYVRTKSQSTRWRPWTARLATSLAIIGYPAGALILLQGDPQAKIAVAGYALLALALAAFWYLAANPLQRIVGEEAVRLDEFELDLRRRAYAFGYSTFTALTALAIFYLAVASDSGRVGPLWTPSTFEQWSAVMWGALLYIFVLPTAYLAWTVRPPED